MVRERDSAWDSAVNTKVLVALASIKADFSAENISLVESSKVSFKPDAHTGLKELHTSFDSTDLQMIALTKFNQIILI